MASRRFVAGRHELVEAGFSPSRIDCWIRNGRLIKVVRSVYSYGRDVDSREAVWRAALIAAGPGSALTARSACEAWGMVGARKSLPLRVEVAARAGDSRVLQGVSPALRRTRIEVVKRQIDRTDICRKDGIDLVRPILAWMDFAVEASKTEVRFAFLEACRLGLVGRREVRECFEMIGGRRGARKIRPLLALWVPELGRIRSVLEGLILLALVERRLPMPRVNTKVGGYEVDFYWPDHGVVLEADGQAFHRGHVQRGIDAAKTRDLEARRLVVLRVTYKEFDQSPNAVLDGVTETLAFRAVSTENGSIGK